jgi:hypothetical protein
MVMGKKIVKKQPVLPLVNRRMFLLMEYVMQSDKYPKIKKESDFLITIGFTAANLWNLKHANYTGKPQSFTWIQVAAACKVYGVDANWLIDEDYTEMFRKDRPMDVVSNLTSAVLMAIDELKKRQ